MRNSEILGEIDEFEIVSRLQAGELRPSDFYRAPGMSESRPLIDFLDLATGEQQVVAKVRKSFSGFEMSRETYELVCWVLGFPFAFGLLWLFWYLMREWLIPFFSG